MRSGRIQDAAFFLAVSAAITLGAPASGQEPGFFGRLLRQATGAGSSPRPAPVEPSRTVPELEPLPGIEPGNQRFAPAPPSLTPVEGDRIPSGAPLPTAPRLVPQPRMSRPPTESDPIVTRITIGRSNDGKTFGMFLQVFADGTVIDSEGVHALGRQAVVGVVEALQSGEPFRVRGHCGGPPTDFVEQVQMTVFERSLGRLRANSFSFSGNTQGCDPGVKRLQNALDALQARISPPMTAAAMAPMAPEAAAPATNAPALAAPALIAPAPPPPVIRLNETP